MRFEEQPPRDARRVPEPLIRGWLRVLCIVLFVWQPVLFAQAASTAIAAIAVRGPAVAVVLGARLAVTAWGVAAAILIVRRREIAVGVTIGALAAAGLLEVFVALTSYFPSNLAPGDAPLYAAGAAFFYAAWIAYMARSSRVKRTLIF
jgi:hypothetical protein